MNCRTYDGTLDHDGCGRPPAPGVVLRTPTGRCHLVVEARRVRSRVHPSRWALRCVRVTAAPTGARVYEFRWHARGPRWA